MANRKRRRRRNYLLPSFGRKFRTGVRAVYVNARFRGMQEAMQVEHYFLARTDVLNWNFTKKSLASLLAR
ncbi:MAG: hypothetical protein DMF23_09010 [Verrucomicrobia bacterium]|nr:MAG: hypothetical protein DMF23_09010 [Verrucomicrobiota bacterium]